MAEKVKLAWMVQVERIYGITRVVGRVVRVQPSGELHNISWQWRFSPEAGDEFGELEVGAYINDREREVPQVGVWGLSARYHDLSIDSPEHARAVARVMVKLDKGMDALTKAEGYVADGNFAGYLVRVGRVLRITDYYVRNNRKGREMSGEMYRRTDGSGVQSWLAHAVSEIDAGRIGEYVH
jgi:hypothetical protein